jgi:hypothetical protein
MRWEEGRATVEDLLSRGELQRVSLDIDSAKVLLSVARHHLASAGAIRENDPEGSYAALYDASRKAFAALLEAQGLRATSRGGHVALREAIFAQFSGLSGGAVLKPFDRLRRRRNELEYPGGVPSIDPEEVGEALARSAEMVQFAEKLIEQLPVY